MYLYPSRGSLHITKIHAIGFEVTTAVTEEYGVQECDVTFPVDVQRDILPPSSLSKYRSA
jgi:hypothetical protein